MVLPAEPLDLGLGPLGPASAATGAVVGGGGLRPLVLGGQRNLPDGNALLELGESGGKTTIGLLGLRHVADLLEQVHINFDPGFKLTAYLPRNSCGKESGCSKVNGTSPFLSFTHTVAE